MITPTETGAILFLASIFTSLTYSIWQCSVRSAKISLIRERLMSIVYTLQLLYHARLRQKIDFNDDDWFQCIKDHFQNGYCSGRLRVIESDPHCNEVIGRTDAEIINWNCRFEQEISDPLIAHAFMAYLEEVRNFGLNIGYLAELYGDGRELWWDRYKSDVYAGYWVLIEKDLRNIDYTDRNYLNRICDTCKTVWNPDCRNWRYCWSCYNFWLCPDCSTDENWTSHGCISSIEEEEEEISDSTSYEEEEEEEEEDAPTISSENSPDYEESSGGSSPGPMSRSGGIDPPRPPPPTSFTIKKKRESPPPPLET